MGYYAQIGFELRAWDGAPSSIFDQLIGLWLPQYADSAGLNQDEREELVVFLECADRAQDGEVPVMRYFDPAYTCSGATQEVIGHVQGLTEFADMEGAFFELRGEGFSGVYCLIGEENEIDNVIWGANQDDLWDALHYGATVRPDWTNYGIHIDARAVRNFLEGIHCEDDVCMICNAAMPEIRALLKAKARELGYPLKSAVIV